ncbi:MAG: hypothetical protein P1P87_10355, partial [Trueperaceae bacterium]|nr:hypothetical protein [Trueperaceae bacterium]
MATLRRLWLALPVLGVAVITLPQLVSIYFERVYQFGPTGRGVVTFLSGVGVTIGLLVGERLGRSFAAAFDLGFVALRIGVVTKGDNRRDGLTNEWLRSMWLSDPDL